MEILPRYKCRKKLATKIDEEICNCYKGEKLTEGYKVDITN